MLRRLPILALLLLVNTLVCCNDGRAPFAGGIVVASIGPAGGQVVSSDGALTLNVPAGALTQMMDIGIERIDPSTLDPDLVATSPESAYRLTPEGLTFAMPVPLTLDLGPTTLAAPGDVAVQIPAVFLDSATSRVLVQNPEIIIPQDNASAMFQGTLTHFSTVVVVKEPVSNVQLRVVYPQALDPGMLGLVTASISTSGMNGLGTSDTINWWADFVSGADFMGNLAIGPNKQVFDPPGSTLSGSTQMTITDQAIFSCTNAPTPADYTLFFEFNLLNASEILTLFAGLDEVEEPNLFVRVRCQTACNSTTGGGGGGMIGQDKKILITNCTDIEGMSIVPPDSPCGAGAGQPPIFLVSGQCQGSASTSFVDPVTGTVSQTELGVGPNNFDSFIIQQDGGPNEALIMSGQQGFFIGFDPGTCNLFPFGMADINFREDCSLRGDDPTKGVLQPGFNSILHRSIDSNGDLITDTTTISFTPRSVAGAPDTDVFLALRGNGDLIMIDDTGPSPVEMTVQNIGTNVRRIRFDPTNQFGVITDFTDNTLTAFEWDMVNMPIVTDVATVGSGPVTPDIQFPFSATTGFNDDTFTILEYDTTTGTFISTVTSPIPFGPEPGNPALNPGHSLFLDDSEGTLAISNFGDGSVILLTDTIP